MSGGVEEFVYHPSLCHQRSQAPATQNTPAFVRPWPHSATEKASPNGWPCIFHKPQGSVVSDSSTGFFDSNRTGASSYREEGHENT